MCNIWAPPAPQPRPVTWGPGSEVRICASLGGEMGALGRVLLWLQLCGRPRVPLVWTSIEAEVSLGWKGRDLRRGWDMEAALAAYLNFLVPGRGPLRFPMPRRWRNRSLLLKDLQSLGGPSVHSRDRAAGSGLRDRSLPQCSSCQSSFLRPIPLRTPWSPSRAVSVL